MKLNRQSISMRTVIITIRVIIVIDFHFLVRDWTGGRLLQECDKKRRNLPSSSSSSSSFSSSWSPKKLFGHLWCLCLVGRASPNLLVDDDTLDDDMGASIGVDALLSSTASVIASMSITRSFVLIISHFLLSLFNYISRPTTTI